MYPLLRVTTVTGNGSADRSCEARQNPSSSLALPGVSNLSSCSVLNHVWRWYVVDPQGPGICVVAGLAFYAFHLTATPGKMASVCMPLPRMTLIHNPKEVLLMKMFAVAMLLVAGLTLSGCGSSSNPGNINGNWTATLTGSQNLSFTTSVIENSDGTLSVSKFSFTTNSSCFASGETETGTFALSGNFNGNVTGLPLGDFLLGQRIAGQSQLQNRHGRGVVSHHIRRARSRRQISHQ